MDKHNENILALVEEEGRNMGYDLPIAWAVIFVYDNQRLLCEKAPELADEVNSICDWVDNGDPYKFEWLEEDEREDE